MFISTNPISFPLMCIGKLLLMHPICRFNWRRFMAWLSGVQQKGVLRVIIESNSSEAVNLINGFPDASHPVLSVILECKRLHKTMWSSSINYVPRNYNNTTDCIAKLGQFVCSTYGTV